MRDTDSFLPLSQSGVPTVEKCGSMCELCTVMRTRKKLRLHASSWCGIYISCWRLFFPSFIFMFWSLHWTLPPAFDCLHSSSPRFGILQSVQPYCCCLGISCELVQILFSFTVFQSACSAGRDRLWPIPFWPS